MAHPDRTPPPDRLVTEVRDVSWPASRACLALAAELERMGLTGQAVHIRQVGYSLRRLAESVDGDTQPYGRTVP